MSHYTEDFLTKTLIAARLFGVENGVVAEDILVGTDGLTLYYLNTGTWKKTEEVMTFNDQGSSVRWSLITVKL